MQDREIERNYDKVTVENAKISEVSLSMADHGCLTLDLTLECRGWVCCYGGYCLGHGFLGADDFEGSAKGLEAIMRIMDVIGVERLEDAVGKYVRIENNGFGEKVTAIGNIIEDKWFNYEKFFKGEE